MDQHRADGCLCLCIFAIETRFCDFDIPVAVFRPDEIIYFLRRHAELVAVKIFRHLGDDLIESAEDPFVGDFELAFIRQFTRRFFGSHEHKTRCVVNLIAEITCGFHLFPVETHVITSRVACKQREAQRVGAVLFNYLKGINAVAERFAHLSALAIAHNSVDIHRFKRAFVHDLVAKHDHTRHPEKDDVVARHQRIGRVEIFEFFRLFRISKRREWPHTGAKPCVQHILILPHRRAAIRAFVWRFLRNNHLAACVAVIGRDAMSPPELPRDAPIANVVHPVEICLFKPFGNELHLAVSHRFDGRRGKRLHIHKPLL